MESDEYFKIITTTNGIQAQIWRQAWDVDEAMEQVENLARHFDPEDVKLIGGPAHRHGGIDVRFNGPIDKRIEAPDGYHISEVFMFRTGSVEVEITPDR